MATQHPRRDEGTIASLSLTQNADRTITVKYGRYQEHISMEGKSPVQILDAVRWAAITAGANFEEDRVWALIEKMWRKSQR